ncbi:unnamed protein product, partial [Rotaria sp. Silwood1]
SQQFAKPGTYQQLSCKGRPCASCGKCRDWYYSGNLDDYKWIQGWQNWKSGDDNWKRYNSGQYWNFFKPRDGKTCSLPGSLYLCFCDDNMVA